MLNNLPVSLREPAAALWEQFTSRTAQLVHGLRPEAVAGGVRKFGGDAVFLIRTGHFAGFLLLADLLLLYIALKTRDPVLRTISLVSRFLAAVCGALAAQEACSTGVWDGVFALRAGIALAILSFAIPGLVDWLGRR